MSDLETLFNPYDPVVMADPVPEYARLREHDPVHRSPIGTWVLFRYADVQAMLRDPSTSVEDRNAVGTPRSELFEELRGDRSGGSRAILNLDPPDHDRLRRIFTKAFTPRTVAALEPRVEELVDQALDRIADEGETDLIGALAFPLPFTVIQEMLGMPAGDTEQVRAWSHALVKTLDPVITEDEIRLAFDAGDQLTYYVRDRIAEKRAHPDDGLLSRLIQAEDDGAVLDEAELVDQVNLLYVAGHETTVNLIGNGALALARHPDQLARLGAEPDLAANAVEELLRWDSPVQYSRRFVMRPTEIDGHQLEPGDAVLTCLGSANHDPEKWGPDVDVLDLGREGAGQHLSFGNGIHHCLGAALARMEGRIALGRLAARFPQLQVAGEPVRNGRIVLRGVDELPVSVR